MDGEIIQALEKTYKVIQTHLSWIILTGKFAYKIKKPLNLGFNDFTTLEKRKTYCEKEISYNGFLAKSLYIGVVPITGDIAKPELEGTGIPIEYAVKMHEFPQEALFSYLIKHKKIKEYHIKDLAEQVALFHQQSPIADKDSLFGEPDFTFMQDNFSTLKSLTISQDFMEDILLVEKRSKEQFLKISSLMEDRKKAGFIRACHGDLHLNNIVMLNDKGVIFDCIEFNEGFRWIDVMSEVAFLLMDLTFYQRKDFASLFLNHYLEITGDYLGTPLLNFYQCYRAMVRAKIAALAFTQNPTSNLKQDFAEYIYLAKEVTSPQKPILTVTSGVSGSGKTIYTEYLLKKEPAIRLRSDVLRKHVSSHLANQAGDRYAKETIAEVYQQLASITEALLESKLSVIVDASCIYHWQRQIFVDLANRLHVHLQLLLFEAPREILERRIAERQVHRQDASEANKEVLALQLANLEPLTESEKEKSFLIHYQVIEHLIRSKEN